MDKHITINQEDLLEILTLILHHKGRRMHRRLPKTVIKEYGQKQYDTWHRSYDIKPPRGESVKDVEKRVEAFIKDLLKFMNKHKGNVAISAHWNSMRPFRKYFEKLSKEKMMKLENPWDDYFVYTVEI